MHKPALSLSSLVAAADCLSDQSVAVQGCCSGAALCCGTHQHNEARAALRGVISLSRQPAMSATAISAHVTARSHTHRRHGEEHAAGAPLISNLA